MTSPAIRVEGLTRDFGPLRAVDCLSFEVPSGAIFGFLGPNGSGKTTAIRLLLGLIPPTGGRAFVLGLDVAAAADAIRQRTGALLEHTGLYERMTAEDNLEYYGRIARMRDGDRRARIRELLEGARLWERRREPVGRWSRGMKQRLAIARALLPRPHLVFLDEPTSGLDAVAAAALRRELAAQARSDGVTVFLTTHNLTEAEKLCERVAVIRHGRLLALGRPEELRRGHADASAGATVTFVLRGFEPSIGEALRHRPEVQSIELRDGEVEVQLHGTTEVGPLVALLVAAGAQVEEIRRPKATLEDRFLDRVDDGTGGQAGDESC